MTAVEKGAPYQKFFKGYKIIYESLIAPDEKRVQGTMEQAKKQHERTVKKEKIVDEIREAIGKYKSIVISGEVGVGKITRTLEALRDDPNVYYIGNPVDYVGKPRPKGYERYVRYITTLKEDMRIIAGEGELLGFDFFSLSQKGATLLIDEIFGRSADQYEKISAALRIENVKVVLITGCLKNVGKLARRIDAGLMLTSEGTILIEKEFVAKMCVILGSDRIEKQEELFR